MDCSCGNLADINDKGEDLCMICYDIKHAKIKTFPQFRCDSCIKVIKAGEPDSLTFGDCNPSQDCGFIDNTYNIQYQHAAGYPD